MATNNVDPALKRKGIWTKKQVLIEERRGRVAMLYVAGMKEAEIAQKLDISKRTVERDVQSMRAEWAKRRLLADDEFDLDMQRIEDVIRTIYPELKSGSVAHIQQFVNLLGRKGRMLAYDRPMKSDVTVRQAGEIQELSDEQLLELIQREAGRKGKKGEVSA